MAWILRSSFSKMAFETHSLIPWNSTNSMALSKIKVFPQIMSRIVYPMLQFQVISTNLPVNIYFNGLRQNLLNLVSSSTLIWYWKCTLKYAMYNELFPLKNRQLTTVLMISEHTNNKSSDHHPLHTSFNHWSTCKLDYCHWFLLPKASKRNDYKLHR